MSFFSGSGGKSKSYGDYLQIKKVGASGPVGIGGGGAIDVIPGILNQGPPGPTGPIGPEGPEGPPVEFMHGGDVYGGHLHWDPSYGSWVVGGVDSVHVGANAGFVGQGTGAVAIGVGAGSENQGVFSVAIGHAAGPANQKEKSIVINATGVPLTSDKAGFFVKPVSATMNNGLRSVVYDTGSGEIRYHTNKTFVLPYPGDDERYLVHACLEGPEAGVYYRGSNVIAACGYVEIVLPAYVVPLADDFTIQITGIRYQGIRTGWLDSLFSSSVLECSRVFNGRFRVYGAPGKEFFWLVHGRRGVIDVAPMKKEVKVEGVGPYTWTL